MVAGSEQVVFSGDGSPTRGFLYVEEAADVFLAAADRYDGPEPVKIRTGAEISIRELAGTIAELTGFEGEIVWDTLMPNGQPRRHLDDSRAERLLDWRAATPLREGLERTIAWRGAQPAHAER